MTTQAAWRTPIRNPEFRKNLEREAPVFANINLLGKCNVDCYFCLGKDIDDYFARQNQLGVHFSEWANFPEFLGKCRDAGIQRLYVTGQNTDALVYQHIGALVDHLQGEWGFDAGLRTNGYLAERHMATLQRCRRSVGVSIHTLQPDVNWTVMRRRDIPDWERILPQIPNLRVSIVLNRHNAGELHDLLRFLARFPNVSYVQVRRICTDTREDYLLPDVEAYEAVFRETRRVFPLVSYFYGAEVFQMYGKEVCFWRTVKTTIDSFNYYTDGTMTDEYFVIEGFLRESGSVAREGDGVTPVYGPGLEGYWRDRAKEKRRGGD